MRTPRLAGAVRTRRASIATPPVASGIREELDRGEPAPLAPGPVQVLTFAQVDFAGQLFYGIDSGTIDLVG